MEQGRQGTEVERLAVFLRNVLRLRGAAMSAADGAFGILCLRRKQTDFSVYFSRGVGMKTGGLWSFGGKGHVTKEGG